MNHPYNYFFDHLEEDIIIKSLQNIKSFDIYNLLKITFNKLTKLFTILSKNNLSSSLFNYTTNDILIKCYNYFILEMEEFILPKINSQKMILDFDEAFIGFLKKSDHFLKKINYALWNRNSVKWIILKWIKKTWINIDEIYIIIDENNQNNLLLKTILPEYKYSQFNDTAKIEYINFIGGIMTLGGLQKDLFNNNNQLPQVKKHISSFAISKNCITNLQYSIFIKNDAYNNKKYWSKKGWNWKSYYKIYLPKNWTLKDDAFFINNINIDSINSYPINNISYYEAEAFCNYNNGRLPREEEWEWVATNRNKTSYPWGIDKPAPYNTNSLSHQINREKIIPINSIFYYPSLHGCRGLLGNQWEWCSSNYYPNHQKHFDFIKPNNELTYPDKVVKGGSWSTPTLFLSPKLRFNINPIYQCYNTGFRIVTSYHFS
jgi:formylglycine-generating enzyme required for sulfatase activity